jgi:opacity protein-like surface antigen
MSRMLLTILLLSLLAPAGAAEDVAAPAPSLAAGYVFTIEAEIGAALAMGAAVDGTRRAIPITGGTVTGAEINGIVVPGGADYQVTGSDGNTRLSAVYMIRTDDEALINVVNDGIIVPPAQSGNALTYFRTSPRFTAPTGKYGWLNNAIFIGAVRFDTAKPGIVIIDVYKVL